MTKIDIISGFLGAGKTTLVKKLIKEAYGKEKLVLIENEFGEIGIDGNFLQDVGIEIKEMNSGCICCSLVGDFSEALIQVMEQFQPERILIEPSGVGKLSDVMKAVKDIKDERFTLNSCTTVVDGKKASIYMKNFGEFFNDQVKHANTIVLSRTQWMQKDLLEQVVALIKGTNMDASLITTPWDEISGMQIRKTMEQRFEDTIFQEMEICPHCHHHHEQEETCTHTHEHHEHCHHHHEHCGHDHHHADEIFTSWGKETIQTYTKEQLHDILQKLTNESGYGTILRAKGMLKSDQGWLYFDFVPEEYEIRDGNPETNGKICVIGSDLKETALEQLFQLD